MTRKTVVAVALTALLTLGGVALTGGAASALSPAVGSMTCTVTGVGKFAPKLTANGTAGLTTVATAFKGVSVAGSCAGNAGIPSTTGVLTPVSVTGAKFKGAGTYKGPAPANSCAVFSSVDSVGTIAVGITWIAAPAIANTIVTLHAPGGPVVSGVPTDTITLPSGATATITGSFAAGPFALSMVTNIVSACGAIWGPYHHYTFAAPSALSV